MYTNLKNVQIIISLMKQYHIKRIVISPGTREAPLAHSMENDNFFTCYSIVDERSAAYFALGLSEAVGEPVCLACTSSTAACNYMPALKEAYEKGIQLIALTADRDAYRLYQMEDQMINQINMYKGYVTHFADIPMVQDKRTQYYCERILNETFWTLDDERKGPIQINYRVPVVGEFTVEKLPKYRKIDRIKKENNFDIYIEMLASRKRILVLIGQDYRLDNTNFVKLLNRFQEKYNCVVCYDHLSNVGSSDFIQIAKISETITNDEFQKFLPDIVITMGGHNWTFMKQLLTYNARRYEHWRISEDGKIMDMSNSLTKVFACSEEEFLEKVTENINIRSDQQYFRLWHEKLKTIIVPDMEFTNFYAIQKLTECIPPKSILHLSILNSTRLANFCRLDESVSSFSNLGTDGIDGCLSTFLGQSALTDQLAFLIIGDLSYLYDVNGILGELKSNQRIMIINNFAGSEFYTNFDINKIRTLGKHIAANHSSKLETTVKDLDVDYYSAENREELTKAIELFTKKSEKPIILEVFTKAEEDSSTLKNFYRINRHYPEVTFSGKAKSKLKKGLKSVLRIAGIKNIKIER